MALALRFDRIEVMPNGDRHVVMSMGQAPLTTESPTLGLSQSVVAWRDEADYFEDIGTEERFRFLLRLALLLWKKNNPDMNNPGLLLGRTFTLTVTTTSIEVAVTT